MTANNTAREAVDAMLERSADYYDAWAASHGETTSRAAWKARSQALSEALARAQSWHESEDKALSKSGRNDADYHWRRLQHREQLDRIRAALPAAEYAAAWDRINARPPAADDDST